MIDKEIEQKIKILLEESTDKKPKISEIASKLHLGKHHRKEIMGIIRKIKKSSSAKRKNILKKQKTVVEGIFDALALTKDKSYAFVRCDDFDVYVSSEDIGTALHNDKVLVELSSDRRGKKSGKVVEILERNSDEFSGIVRDYKGKKYFIPDNRRIHLNCLVNKDMKAQKDEKVLVKISNWGNSYLGKLPVCNVIEILGKAGEPEVEILSIIKEYDLPLEFPENVYDELKNINESISETEITKRVDLRDIITFTIDPESAKDFDDAVSLVSNKNTHTIYVHIADVANFVKPGMKIFNSVLDRGNSYYFPKKVIPMLPELISNKICSLRPNEDKCTITVETEVDEDLNILNQKVYESIIRSDYRFNYKEIDDLFGGKNSTISPEISQILEKTRLISQKMSKKRNKQGYIGFNLPEAEFIYDDNGYLANIKRSYETESHKLIENFMLLANEYIATFLSDSSTIFRVHGLPDEEDMQRIFDISRKYKIKFSKSNDVNHTLQNVLEAIPTEKHRVFDKLFLRNMKKAKYSVVNIGHFGLAMQNYTHFTSPIRRLCDLIIHHQIKEKLGRSKVKFNKKTLETYAKIATNKEILADTTERDAEYRFERQFMKKYLGEDFTGMIVNMTKSMMFIELDKFPIKGIVKLSEMKDDYYKFINDSYSIVGKRSGKKYRLADKVKVKIVAYEDDLLFQLL